ncbi:hypothetical protein CHARACLAT_008845 [Characodon lateralis]|uniref:SH3 domain-containing protein n=1 Tax=Characodon lateralis TaxID=208331 RepID=A0ABU7EJ90_9TELE|nr:hypothetical protein [Characodon lateralis]
MSGIHVPWSSGTECVAKYNFKPGTEQDLPFCKGDVLTIIGVTRDPNWYKARNTVGREGTIPANYVQKREGVKSGGKLSLMPCGRFVIGGNLIVTFHYSSVGRGRWPLTLSLVLLEVSSC